MVVVFLEKVNEGWKLWWSFGVVVVVMEMEEEEDEGRELEKLEWLLWWRR